MRAVRVNQNGKVVGGQLNSELKLTIKLHKAKGSCRFRWSFSVGPSLRATSLTVTLFSHFNLIHCYYKNITYSHCHVNQTEDSNMKIVWDWHFKELFSFIQSCWIWYIQIHQKAIWLCCGESTQSWLDFSWYHYNTCPWTWKKNSGWMVCDSQGIQHIITAYDCE